MCTGQPLVYLFAMILYPILLALFLTNHVQMRRVFLAQPFFSLPL